MASITHSKTTTPASANRRAGQIHRALCADCDWTYVRRLVEGELSLLAGVVRAHADGHRYGFNHTVEIHRRDFIDTLIWTLTPRTLQCC